MFANFWKVFATTQNWLVLVLLISALVLLTFQNATAWIAILDMSCKYFGLILTDCKKKCSKDQVFKESPKMLSQTLTGSVRPFRGCTCPFDDMCTVRIYLDMQGLGSVPELEWKREQRKRYFSFVLSLVENYT